MLALEAVGELGHRRSLALALQIAQGVTTLADELTQPTGLRTRCGGRPIAQRTNGDAPLPPRLRLVIEHEGARAGGRDANCKAGHRGIEMELVAGGRQRQSLDQGVSERRHGWISVSGLCQAK